MNPIDTYISACLAKNISLATIKSNLIAAGWNPVDVNASLAKHQQPTTTTNVITPTPVVVSKKFMIDPSALLLRIGLAFVFVFAAVSLSLNPAEGEHYLPTYVSAIIPAKLFLTVFGIYEIVLSIWLLTGKLNKYAASLAAVTLILITSLNIASISILFRNVAIIFAAFSLACMPEREHTPHNN